MPFTGWKKLPCVEPNGTLMKATLLYIVPLLFFGSGASAQGYIPMLVGQASWQDENATAYLGPNISLYECMRYHLDGDSLVDGVTYRVLRLTGIQTSTNHVYSNMSSQTVWDGEFWALLREDTTERRVYIRPSGWPSDILLYDFSVGVGPYPSTYRYRQWSNMQVTSVDTMWLADGPHRRIDLLFGESIIEGVGAMSGFLETGLGNENHWLGHMVCHVVDGSEIHVVESTPSCPCGFNVGTASSSVPSPLRIGPSPTEGPCRLRGAWPNAPFLVYTNDGRVVLSGTCTGDGGALIDLSDLPGGTYIVEVIMPDAPHHVKIIRQ